MARHDGFFRDCKMSDLDHNRFVQKNKMIALASQPIKAYNEKNLPTTQRCSNCNRKRNCKLQPVKVREGVASYGGEEFKCESWEPQKTEELSKKKIKSLMRNFKRL
jgi:hypothetical protein